MIFKTEAQLQKLIAETIREILLEDPPRPRAYQISLEREPPDTLVFSGGYLQFRIGPQHEVVERRGGPIIRRLSGLTVTIEFDGPRSQRVDQMDIGRRVVNTMFCRVGAKLLNVEVDEAEYFESADPSIASQARPSSKARSR